MTRQPLRQALLVLASLVASGCIWIHPSEPHRAVPSGVALPRFEEVPVDFAHHWDRTTSHHLTGAAVLDLDGDGDRYQDLVIAQNTGQVEILRNLRDGSFAAVPLASGYGFWMASTRARTSCSGSVRPGGPIGS
jgi:hypothetical protein